MAMYKATLFDLEGEVLQFRPLASPTLVERWINARIRQAIDSRTYWSSLLTRGILNIPAAYKTGTVSIPNGSTVVTGSATAWPVNDVVNTTIPAGVSDLQYVEVTPVSMTGITNDSWVLVDTGASAEAVAVIETTATTFTAKFSKTHAASCTVTASRLAGRQLFLGAQFSPYLVTAVTSATTLLIQLPWGGPAATAVPYQIIQVYYSFASDMKDLLCVVDPSQPYELELHVPLARVASPETPDAMVFDLDPGEPADIMDCARVALILRDLLSPLGLAGYVKTSGQKGLHVYVPLNRAETTFADTKKFSKAVAEIVQKNYPDLVTAKMTKENRHGRVFINWEQNDSAKTMICVYSLRARKKPMVSFPLAWRELETLAGPSDPERLQVIYSEAVTRAEKQGDLFQEVLEKRQKLPHL